MRGALREEGLLQGDGLEGAVGMFQYCRGNLCVCVCVEGEEQPPFERAAGGSFLGDLVSVQTRGGRLSARRVSWAIGSRD